MRNNKKILIVEDDEAISKMLSGAMKKEGFEVLQATDGEQGLAMAIKEQPDLILMDVMMPKMNGLEMLEKLRKDKWGANAKVLILTNLTDPEHVLKAIQDKAYDFLVKSDWSMEELVKKVKEKLGL